MTITNHVILISWSIFLIGYIFLVGTTIGRIDDLRYKAKIGRVRTALIQGYVYMQPIALVAATFQWLRDHV